MKSGLFAKLGCALAACLLSPLAAPGQEQAARAEVRFVVQVEYLKGAPLAYEAVPGGAWYGRFARVAAPPPRAAADTVRAVDVKTAKLDGERVEIKVGVHVGERFFDRLDEVATYTAAPGEAVTAGDLERVGVAPFVFRVLRVNSADAAAPAIVNKTQSISAVVTDFTPLPLPRATLTLQNLSAKRVRAVEVRGVFRGRDTTVSLAAEAEGRILIEPGATYEKKIMSARGVASAADFTPEALESVVIASAVFEDYSYEGEGAPAAYKRAMDEGQRLQLARLVALVRKARAAGDVETIAALGRLRSAIEALDDAAPQASVDAILKGLTAPPPSAGGSIKGYMEGSMHRVRRGLLDDLARFEEGFKSSPGANSFGGWLKERQERYESWLARL